MTNIRTALPLLVACALAACGGSGGTLPADLSVVSITFVTSNDAPLDPTLTALPRNTWIRIEFTKPVAPASIDAQSIRVRQGPAFTTEAPGFFHVDGAVVRFDPTRLPNGGPHPYGFEGPAGYRIQLRSLQEASGVVTSADGDPLVLGSTLDFAVTDRFIVENVPPRVLGTRFLPEPDANTGLIDASAILRIDFDETLARDAAALARQVVEPRATVDVRFTQAPENVAAGVAGRIVPGRARLSPDARTIEFVPFFGFGDAPLEFEVRVFDGIRDLAGNALANPSTLGPFVCDGTGSPVGSDLHEDFFTTADRDAGATETDWGLLRPGICEPPPITTRQAYALGSDQADRPTFSDGGTYLPYVDPLNGATYNQVDPNVMPETFLGRRVQLAFPPTELGPAGTIIGLAWGPHRNATFDATYHNVRISAGYLAIATNDLGTTFAGNMPDPTVLYFGRYDVGQSANVGNTPGLPRVPHKPGYGSFGIAPCNGVLNYNQPLYDFTGFYPWPDLQTTFDWDPGEPADNHLVLEFEVPEGDNYQQIRSLFDSGTPCAAGVGLTKFRWLLGVVGSNEGYDAPGYAINPAPTTMDTQITISNFRTVAQSQFYTPIGDPLVSTGGATYGTDTDYLPAVVDIERMGSTRVEVEYQGAMALDGDRETIDVNQSFTPWTTNVNDCDGMPYLRWRLRFVGDYHLNVVPIVRSVQVPVRDASAGP